MSEDLQSQRYYVLERISELREQIPQAMQTMVVFRARIEKYRQTDLSAAHDTYDALHRVRDDLTQALADAQPPAPYRKPAADAPAALPVRTAAPGEKHCQCSHHRAAYEQREAGVLSHRSG